MKFFLKEVNNENTKSVTGRRKKHFGKTRNC